MGETNQATLRWADEIDDEDDFGTGTSIVTNQEVTAKEGERIETEIRLDPETGKKTKIIRTFKLEKKLVSKGVIERRKWAKYGQSKNDRPGPNSSTTIVADEVLMQFLTKDQYEISEKTAFDAIIESKGHVRCRYCQDSHFSAKCPFRDSGIAPELLIKPKDLEGNKTVDSVAKPGVFVPPAMRGGNRRGETMNSAGRKDEFTIRVSNLPESMSETDMQELCNPFGKIDRMFLAKDRTTGICKGFAFVTYQLKEDAEKALQGLSGYGYDHLILQVEWSNNRPNN